MPANPQKTRIPRQTERERELAPKRTASSRRHVKLQPRRPRPTALLKKRELAANSPGPDGGGSAAPPSTSTRSAPRPLLHLVLELRATGGTALLQVPVLVTFNADKYRMPRSLAHVPCMVPGVTMRGIFEIECIDEDGVDEDVTILILQPLSPEDEQEEATEDKTPLVCSKLRMPQSELLES